MPWPGQLRQTAAILPKVEDELGFLVNSFNAMTGRIAHARNALEEGDTNCRPAQLLETVLGGLSTRSWHWRCGGRSRHPGRTSRAAEQILGVPVG